jgi:putative exporter of polyketide antibiotics
LSPAGYLNENPEFCETFKPLTVFMVYIISGFIMVLCIAVIIFSLRVYKENREMKAELKKKERDQDRVIF